MLHVVIPLLLHQGVHSRMLEKRIAFDTNIGTYFPGLESGLLYQSLGSRLR